jgi:hypothetical protein
MPINVKIETALKLSKNLKLIYFRQPKGRTVLGLELGPGDIVGNRVRSGDVLPARPEIP